MCDEIAPSRSGARDLLTSGGGCHYSGSYRIVTGAFPMKGRVKLRVVCATGLMSVSTLF